MNKQFLKHGVLWGFLVWLFGFAVSMVFFMFVPVQMIGWFITPLWVLFVLWVLLKMIPRGLLSQYVQIGAVWLAVALVLDYLVIITLFDAEGYYKFDVYLYYALTFLFPVFIGLWKKPQVSAVIPVE